MPVHYRVCFGKVTVPINHLSLSLHGRKNRQAVHNWEFCSCILNAAAVDQKQWPIFSPLSPQGKRTTEEYIWRHQCCQKDRRGRIQNGQAGSHYCWQCKLLKFYPKGFDTALYISSNNPIILRELHWWAPSTLSGLNGLATSVATTLKQLYWIENSGTNFHVVKCGRFWAEGTALNRWYTRTISVIFTFLGRKWAHEPRNMLKEFELFICFVWRQEQNCHQWNCFQHDC